jgi:4-aminobutyrate aminotransferase-like enzyme
MNAGHCNPEVIEPVIDQIRTLQHTTTIYLTEPQLRLAEKLAELAPGDLRRSFFCASGSEATEGAMLLACLHTQRPGIIAMTGSLHGRTRWAMNATGLPMWRSDPFPLEHVHHATFGDVAALRDLLHRHRDQIAAVIAEPIQGNGGIVVPPDDYWPAVRALCDEMGVLLILDEVQTGFNRTGAWFACAHWGVAPDILCLSKAMGNGFPIAAFVATDAIAASFSRPSASTHGGNPVSATAALATIAFHERYELGCRASRFGRQLAHGLAAIAADHPRRCGQPRGKGLMQAVPIIESGAPAPGLADELLERLKDQGVLAGKTGPDRNILSFLPPLVIEAGEIEEICTALAQALGDLP